MVFSATRWPAIPTRSNPPWPASITTTVEGRSASETATALRCATGVGVARGATARFSREERELGTGKPYAAVATNGAATTKLKKYFRIRQSSFGALGGRAESFGAVSRVACVTGVSIMPPEIFTTPSSECTSRGLVLVSAKLARERSSPFKPTRAYDQLRGAAQ